MPLDKNSLLRVLVAERGPLLGFLYSLARDRDLAEDCFQNLVVIISEKQPVVNDRQHFLAWARRAARFEMNNALRKRRKTIPLDDKVLEALESQWQIADKQTGPLVAEALQKCLSSMTPNVRNLVRLRYEEGLVGEELARTLNRTLNAVHVALSRAYRMLAACIDSRIVAEGNSDAR
jgi:RNA polymerase sigma-70 factor (ECF subfamily)